MPPPAASAQSAVIAGSLGNFDIVNNTGHEAHGFEIISMPPPSSGGIALIEMLNILEPYELKTKGLLTAPAVPGLVLIDAWRYADPGDPAFTWHHRNGYQADSLIPDSRIDYVLVGLPRRGRGKVRSAALAGAEPVAGAWPSDHFAVVAEIQE